MSVTRMVLGTALVVILCGHLVLGYDDSSEEYGTMSEYDQSPGTYKDWLNELLLRRETRGGKRCGKRRCYGLCCGGYRCCKKGWNCRYMNAIRTYTCIP